jgi:hypothetical protein
VNRWDDRRVLGSQCETISRVNVLEQGLLSPRRSVSVSFIFSPGASFSTILGGGTIDEASECNNPII